MITQSLGALKGTSGWSVAAAHGGGGGGLSVGCALVSRCKHSRVRPGRLKLAVMWNLLTQLSELVGSYLGAQLI